MDAMQGMARLVASGAWVHDESTDDVALMGAIRREFPEVAVDQRASHDLLVLARHEASR